MLYIAWRYFYSRAEKTFTHYLSWFSIGMVAVGAMALMVGLSAFNGMESLLRSHYTAFDPEISLIPRKGYSFSFSDSLSNYLDQSPGVEAYTPVFEDYALASYRGQQRIIKLKALRPEFLSRSPLRDYLQEGTFSIQAGPHPQALIGEALRVSLSISLRLEEEARLYLFYPTEELSFSTQSLYVSESLPISGSFSLNRSQDMEYVLVPLSVAHKLIRDSSRSTSVALRLTKGTSAERLATTLDQDLGDQIKVLTREQQHQSIYRLLRIEKFFVFLVFGFILLVSSFGLFFVLLILFLEKRTSLSLLTAWGARPRLLAGIFLCEGVMISCIGAVSGLLAGLVICYLQQKYGWISLGTQGIEAAYPIEVRSWDVVSVLAISVGMSVLTAIRPAWLAYKHKHSSLKEHLIYTI